MRKQTKLVAVLSAAALLAMGASMTSFAAGWQKDDEGTWYYYDKDGEMVADQWKKDGNKWFYLDDEGEMAVDQWVDDTYYVGADGAMLRNEWLKTIADDDVDDPNDEGEHWYYFDSKGQKLDNTHRKINGKTYYFNSDGEMRYGWYSPGTDGKGRDIVFYLGEEDEGWRRDAQWLWLERPDENDDLRDGEWDDASCGVGCDDEGWYWFGSDGRMYNDPTSKKRVNGKDYFFNKDGQMLYEWINTKADDGFGNAENRLDGVVGNVASGSDLASASVANGIVDGMRYANQVEEGNRAKGWYEIAGVEDAGTDGDTDWYFFKDGKAKKAGMTDRVANATDDGKPVYRARIKCDGKYFCFNEVGQMQDGLQYIDGNMYYFDANGYQKTGKISNVEEADDDLYAYAFVTKNGGNGKGENGIKDGYLYWNGKRVEADDDYRLVAVDGKVYLVNNKGKVQKSDKVCDLEGVEDDVKVYINKATYDVTGYQLDKGKGISTSVNTQSKANLVQAGVINIPTITIYDHVFAPTTLGDTKNKFAGKMYNSNMDIADVTNALVRQYNQQNGIESDDEEAADDAEIVEDTNTTEEAE